MGQITSLLLGLIVVAGFAIFGATLFTISVNYGVQNGGQIDNITNYTMFNQSQGILNQSQEFKNDLLSSIQTSQQSDPSTPVGSDWTLAGSAIIKSIIFSFNSLGLMFNLITSAYITLASYFQVPFWVLTVIISSISIIFGMAVVGVITRSNP